MHHHVHDPSLIILSVLIAIFASYTALDLANSVTVARGRARLAWLAGGSLAMGVGIWSMHFVGMLAFHMPGIQIAYDIFLLILSIAVAVCASALALYLISRRRVTHSGYILGSLIMGAAIAGMHYIGIASMRMDATWTWNQALVALSILIAVSASFVALQIAFRLRSDVTRRGFWYRGAGGVVMGLAIAGMHYTAMAAMTFYPGDGRGVFRQDRLLATEGLAIATVGMTLLVLGIALTGSIVNRALARRQALIDTRDEFLSVASHELKTPLTTLMLQTQLRRRTLERNGQSAFAVEALTKMFEDDLNQFTRLSRLIDDMLDISRIDTGKLSIQRDRVDLCQLTREVVERHAEQLRQAQCDPTLDLGGDETVEGNWDRFRIEQIIANLLTNAAKYGGNKPIQVVVRRAGPIARLTVRDQGPGIAPADRDRIFERFERASSASQISGLGLGLYISAEIARMHGGAIRLESRPGAGAAFHLELPV